MSATPAGREWLEFALPQPPDRRRRDRPLRGGAPHRTTLAFRLRVLALAAGKPVPSPYAAFLFETRTGYCQHFAGSMALLLRLNGVPARVALGFTTGDPRGEDTYLVDTTDAHAWVEAYFPGSGWVPSRPDPRPGAARLRDAPTSGPKAGDRHGTCRRTRPPRPPPARPVHAGHDNDSPPAEVTSSSRHPGEVRPAIPTSTAALALVLVAVARGPRALLAGAASAGAALTRRASASVALVYADLRTAASWCCGPRRWTRPPGTCRSASVWMPATCPPHPRRSSTPAHPATAADLADVAALRRRLRRRLRDRRGRSRRCSPSMAWRSHRRDGGRVPRPSRHLVLTRSAGRDAAAVMSAPGSQCAYSSSISQE